MTAEPVARAVAKPVALPLVATTSGGDIGLWLEWNFAEGAGIYSVNSASTAPTITDVLGTPEQCFALCSYFTTLPTDLGRTDPNGNANASRWVTGSGTQFFGWNSAPAAGTYTVSIWAKSNTGVSQDIRIYDGGSWGADDPATHATEWTRITRTVTNPTAICIGNNGTSAADVDLWGLDVTPGASAGVLPSRNWELLFRFDRQPSWTARGLSISSLNRSAWAFSDGRPKTLTACTFYFIVKRSGAPVFADYEPLLANHYSGETLHLYTNLAGNGIGAEIGGITTANSKIYLGDSDGHFHVLTYACDGSDVRIFLDGVMIVKKSGTMGSVVIDRLFLSNYVNNAAWSGEINYVSGYDVAHSAAQVTSKVASLITKMATKSVTVNYATNFITFEGDSITDAAGSFARANTLNPNPHFAVLAVSGSQLSHLNARAADLDERIAPNTNNILCALFGTNDALTMAAGDYYPDWKAWWTARRAAGWDVLVPCTLNPRSDDTADAFVVAFNALLRADNFYDALIDFGADATIGEGNGDNTTYYADGLHPTAACQAIMITISDAVLTTVLL